jgi:hypothetical protein
MHIVENDHRFQGYLWHFCIYSFTVFSIFLHTFYVRADFRAPEPRCTVPAPLSLWRVRCKEIKTRPMHSLQNTTRPLGKCDENDMTSIGNIGEVLVLFGTYYIVLFCHGEGHHWDLTLLLFFLGEDMKCPTLECFDRDCKASDLPAILKNRSSHCKHTNMSHTDVYTYHT